MDPRDLLKVTIPTIRKPSVSNNPDKSHIGTVHAHNALLVSTPLARLISVEQSVHWPYRDQPISQQLNVGNRHRSREDTVWTTLTYNKEEEQHCGRRYDDKQNTTGYVVGTLETIEATDIAVGVRCLHGIAHGMAIITHMPVTHCER